MQDQQKSLSDRCEEAIDRRQYKRRACLSQLYTKRRSRSAPTGGLENSLHGYAPKHKPFAALCMWGDSVDILIIFLPERLGKACAYFLLVPHPRKCQLRVRDLSVEYERKRRIRIIVSKQNVHAHMYQVSIWSDWCRRKQPRTTGVKRQKTMFWVDVTSITCVGGEGRKSKDLSI